MRETRAECLRRFEHTPEARDYFTFPVLFAALCEKHGLDKADFAPLTDAQKTALLTDADKLLSGYPLQYYLGVAEFCEREFLISEGVLIPRADTEVLVKEALSCLSDGGAVYDLCCGSGCIAISLLIEKPSALAVAVDLSDEALTCAADNAAKFEVRERLILRKRDLLREKAASKPADLIVMNPPYITDAAMETLPKNVLCEPRMALSGGFDGLNFYRAILMHLPEYLKETGVALFEIGCDQGADLKKLCDSYGYVCSILPDTEKRDRVAKITLAKNRII